MPRLLSVSWLLFIFTCSFYRGLLDFSYFLFVNPLFESSGFVLNVIWQEYFLSWVLYILILLVTPVTLNKPSDYFMVYFVVAFFAPLLCFYGMSSFGLEMTLSSVCVYFFMRMFLCDLSIFPSLKLWTIKNGREISISIAFISVLLLAFWYYYSGAYKYINFNFFDVYEFRDKSAELALFGFWAYFNNWVFGVFSLFLMSVCLYEKRFYWFVFLFIVQVLFFAVSNHKSVLFYPFLVLFIWFYFRFNRSLLILPFAFSCVIILCLLLYWFFENIMPGSMFIRRMLFVPSYLTYAYFDFFSFNDKVYWSNSVLSGFIDYPYDLSLNRLISSYIGHEGGANNGFIATGYAQAGFLGISLYALIFSIVLKIYDNFSDTSNLPVWLIIAITIVPVRTALLSSDLFTTFLTHGMMVNLVILFIYRKRGSRINET